MNRKTEVKKIFETRKKALSDVALKHLISNASVECLNALIRCPSVNGNVDLSYLEPEYLTEIGNILKEFEAPKIA